jgi:hypothetical protein
MSEAIGAILNISTALVPKVIDEYDKYRKKKKFEEEKAEIENKVFNALRLQINSTEKHFEEMADIAEKFMKQILLLPKDTLSPKLISALIEEYPLSLISKFAELFKLFAEIAQGCKGISYSKAFMENLKKYNPMLHDFVSNMGDSIHRRGNMRIDFKIYGFLKIYKKEILASFEKGIDKIDQAKFDSIIKESKEVADIFNRRILPLVKKGRGFRSLQRKYNKVLEKLKKNLMKVKIQKSDEIDFKDFVPTKLLKAFIVFEEAKLLENNE